MYLGEHLQETYAIEVNRDVTDNLTTVKHCKTLAKHSNTESMLGSPRRLMPKILRCVRIHHYNSIHTPNGGSSLGSVLTSIGVYHPQ